MGQYMMWWRTLAIRIAAAAWLVAGAVFAAAPPNIVFYFIDDLGWRDVSFLGS